MRARARGDSGKSGERISHRSHHRAAGTSGTSGAFRLRHAGASEKIIYSLRRIFPVCLAEPRGNNSSSHTKIQSTTKFREREIQGTKNHLTNTFSPQQIRAAKKSGGQAEIQTALLVKLLRGTQVERASGDGVGNSFARDVAKRAIFPGVSHREK